MPAVVLNAKNDGLNAFDQASAQVASARQSMRLAGRTLDYTATVGTLPVRDAKGKVIAVVQPHRYTRLRDLFDEWRTAFNDADTLSSEMLTELAPELMDVVDADGVAIYQGEEVIGYGTLPSIEDLARIRRQIEARDDEVLREGVVGALHVDAIGRAFPELADLAPLCAPAGSTLRFESVGGVDAARRVAEGETFDRLSLDRVMQELVRQYNNRGKYNVQITPTVTPLDRNRVDVTIDVSVVPVLSCGVMLPRSTTRSTRSVPTPWCETRTTVRPAAPARRSISPPSPRASTTGSRRCAVPSARSATCASRSWPRSPSSTSCPRPSAGSRRSRRRSPRCAPSWTGPRPRRPGARRGSLPAYPPPPTAWSGWPRR